ncbi:MFS transporter [Castellaniella daejeonensis]|jgi:predicted MFS family arabinose efflux permease|uniref:MFS transporter n=1 Tax=Castellaniella daejeonensis TaxID=659013 RepID=A0ABN0TTE2_9BURK|nr:MFS transporter [Castellaniella sp.]HET8702654.1 MFS transporter [Castellaniella sp.]
MTFRTQASITWLLCACCFASIASMRACDTLLPAIGAEFAASTGEAARTVYTFAIAYGVFQLCFGPLGDRYGKLRIIALCALACVIGNGLAFLAAGLDQLVLARILSGACAAGIFPLAMAWIGDNVPYETRQTVLARLVGASVTGVLAGQWLSGLIAQWSDWRHTFLALAAAFLGAGGLLLKAALDGSRQRHAAAPALPARQALREILASPTARSILTVTSIEGALAFGALAFIPSALQRHHDVSLSMAGGIAACYGIGGFVYARLAARLLRSLGEPGLALLGGLMLCAGFVSLAYAPTLALTPLACALAGFGFYGLHNTLQTQATQMAPAARGMAMSLFACVLFLGQSVGVMAAAWVADHGRDTWVFALAGAGLLALSLEVARRTRARQQHA